VSEANNPGNEAIDSDNWIPACAGMTVILAWVTTVRGRIVDQPDYCFHHQVVATDHGQL